MSLRSDVDAVEVDASDTVRFSGAAPASPFSPMLVAMESTGDGARPCISTSPAEDVVTSTSIETVASASSTSRGALGYRYRRPARQTTCSTCGKGRSTFSWHGSDEAVDLWKTTAWDVASSDGPSPRLAAVRGALCFRIRCCAAARGVRSTGRARGHPSFERRRRVGGARPPTRL